MKKLLIMLIVLLTAVSLAGCAEDDCVTCPHTDTEDLAGGWTEVRQDMDDELTEIFNSAVANYEGKETFGPLYLLETQVVAGTNYAFVCNVCDEEGKSGLKRVVVYQDLDGNCSISLIETYLEEWHPETSGE